jgi:nicotinamidase-related amidase
MNRTGTQVILDISTQRDLFLPDGKFCISNKEQALANIRRIIAYARVRSMPVLSLAEVYPNNNGCSEPMYCLDGTEGQRKINYTLLNNRVVFPADSNQSIPTDILASHRQIVLHQRTANPFDEPQIDRLLTELEVDGFVIIGCSAEQTVKLAALGLLHRSKKVTVITDAVGYHNNKEAKLTFRKIKAKGGILTKTDKFAGSSRLRGVGLYRYKLCRR